MYRYNFYGITGDFSEDAEDYGVQQFKKASMLMFTNTLEISSNLYTHLHTKLNNY